MQQFKKTVFNSAKKKSCSNRKKNNAKKWSCNNGKNINSKVHGEKFPKQRFSNNVTRSFIIIYVWYNGELLKYFFVQNILRPTKQFNINVQLYSILLIELIKEYKFKFLHIYTIPWLVHLLIIFR